MPSWELRTGPIALVRSSLAGVAPTCCTVSSRSFIEQNGLHAALLLCFNATGPSSCMHSIALFPTGIPHARNPRGYLQVPLVIPPLPGNPCEICYDGIAITFQIEQPAVRLSAFASPEQPTIWTVWEYEEPQETQPEMRELVKTEGTFRVWRVSRWSSAIRFEMAHTCVSESALTSPFSDRLKRSDCVTAWTNVVGFSCPDAVITAAVHFAKIRTCEAVFDARKLGRVHSPGGGMFYAGVWCNDQAEYAAPVLAMLGSKGSREREVALNSLRVLAQYFDREKGTLAYSVEIDGGYVGKLDRGDAAMFAWGAAKVILTVAENEVTAEVFPWVQFACDLLIAKIENSAADVVTSESDELEGRFSTGKANLSVNCIAILALETASEAALTASEPSLSAKYTAAASSLRGSAERHFRTSDRREYAYYSGCNDARGWVVLTALAGLPRGDAALRHVLKDLWSEEGVLTSAEASVTWDRCTLYTVRALFANGLVEEGEEMLRVLAGRRVREGVAAPYMVENNESFAQLAAESALLVRVVTEGLLGIEVRSGRVIKLRPRCPVGWGKYEVKKVCFADVLIDFRVERDASGMRVEVTVDRWTGWQEFAGGREIKLSVPEKPGTPMLEMEVGP